MPDFRLESDFDPAGDQPEAVDQLVDGLEAGYEDQTLLGVTGSGKTFTMANVIEEVQTPTLVISHNKTLAAQLYEEFRDFFPDNAVHYFVSYYDYYQPEAYVPQNDQYIAKEADRNEEIEKHRHAATQALMTRDDVIVVSSVSCIYGLGDPDEYHDQHVVLRAGDEHPRDELLRALVDIQYSRNDEAPKRGTFRVRGDTIDVVSADGETVTRIEMFGDEIDRLQRLDPVTGRVEEEAETVVLHPATHYITDPDRLDEIVASIDHELEERLKELRAEGRELEAQRLEQRTRHDVEMLEEVGFCSGIENYSLHLTNRSPGDPPSTLMDYFPDDYLTIVDESHRTVPQIGGMYEGDRSRKEKLVDHGFRLPSARDNRPLTWDEFRDNLDQTIYMSATPGDYERKVSDRVVEQIVRPTYLVDPEVDVRDRAGQVEDLLGEVRERAQRDERVLVTTLTKRMAEDLCDYLASQGERVRYLHSDIETLDRVELLENLRAGAYDCLVGVNLLREGLDLPEVSLVAIMDADREGFLRSETSLIQTMGRAARHVKGKAILYAEEVTDSMQRAIDETERRRRIQERFNEEHDVEPRTIEKRVTRMQEDEERPILDVDVGELSQDKLEVLLDEIVGKMRVASKRLDFETAAVYRDKAQEIREHLYDTPDHAELEA
jgi:excinuclease ABC subunit B